MVSFAVLNGAPGCALAYMSITECEEENGKRKANQHSSVEEMTGAWMKES